MPVDNPDNRGIVVVEGGTHPPEGTDMAAMLIKTHHDAHVTKAACHCGRRQCSADRRRTRREARRIERREVRRQVAAELAYVEAWA
ncbi:hypothetical protein PBI_BERNARDO_51 [Mycobacterium phage Bernardo]|uniref:Uncharacterized protein n=1 Tax=Mycobacterium phage Bernardo TaxID=1429903 RepID=V5R969_9CAUD|nr:hypothetical protein X818_gp051 [Mycobacterium phage Bernardo]AHB31728.1 hypothetical protein PBI_BERNARDO_51 [Mycobacterium phage Bernardo]